MAITVGSVSVSTSEPEWQSGQAVSVGDRRSSAQKIYEADTAGTTGNSPPLHLNNDTKSDGVVDWTHVGDDTGDVTKNGVAEEVYDKLLGDTETQHGITATVATKKGIADLANAVALVAQHVKDHAKAKVTTSDSIQKVPDPVVAGDPTDPPDAEKLLDIV